MRHAIIQYQKDRTPRDLVAKKHHIDPQREKAGPVVDVAAGGRRDH